MSREDWTVVLVLFAVYAAMLVTCTHPTPDYVKRVYYDCRLAEISPDVPPAVKEQCRQRQQQWIQPQKGL